MDVRPVREVSPWSLASGVRLRELIKLPRGVVVTWEVLGVIAGLIVWAVRHYVATGTVVMLIAAWVQFGTLWVAVPLAALVPLSYGVVKWQHLRSSTEASTVGGVAQGLARIRTLQKRWPGVMHQLRMCSRDGSQTPPLTQAVATETGVKARVITGAIAADSQQLLKLETQIAAGMFCDRVIVRSVSPSVASIRFDWGEHLRREYTLSDIPELPPAKKGTPALIRFGVHADGSPASIVSNLSTLVGGVSGSGKSSTAWALLAGYLEQVPVRLRVVDPPGAEFPKLGEAVGKGFVHSYGLDPNLVEHSLPGSSSLEDFWADLERAFKRRLRSVSESGMRMHVPTAEEPLDITLIDELLPIAEELKKKNAPTDHIVGKIAYLGRKAGFVVIALTQAAQVDTIGRIRDLFPQRLSHKTGNRYNTDAILGDGAESDGARASRLDLSADQGVGYMASGSGYLALRSARVMPGEMDEIAGGNRPTPVLGRGPEPCSVYAFWGRNNEWLYVGKAEADRVKTRWQEHAADKWWWDQVERKDVIDTYPDEKTALTAEAVLIRKQRPKYNKQHNTGKY